ncbi:MAG TPA: hypothetical protein VLB79_11640, partial [Solirubrobacterales bacterium]|nr:hypothetical protein [Solirubrobacterales bacterium]
MYEQDGITPGQSESTGAPKVSRRWVGDTSSTASTADAGPEGKREYRPDPAWDKLLLIVGAIVVVVALLVVPGLLNRGGQNPVAAAAEATGNVPGVRITFTGRSQGSAAMTMRGRGVLNGETNSASIAMSASGSTVAGTESFSLEEIVAGGDVYLRSPELGSAFGDSAKWLLMRSEVFGDLLQSNASGTGMSASPTQQLGALEDASYQVDELGRERVNGVITTHYAALLDLDKVTEQLKSEVSGEFGDLIERSMDQVSSATADVWIDVDGLIRREASSSTMGSLGTFTMTMDFSHYGIRPNIQAPPASQVYDVTP